MNSLVPSYLFFDSPSVIEPFASYSIVEAVMASPTIKKLKTNFGYQLFKNRNIQDIVFDVAYECFDTNITYHCALDIRRNLMSLWHCVNGNESSSFMPPGSITFKI